MGVIQLLYSRMYVHLSLMSSLLMYGSVVLCVESIRKTLDHS